MSDDTGSACSWFLRRFSSRVGHILVPEEEPVSFWSGGFRMHSHRVSMPACHGQCATGFRKRASNNLAEWLSPTRVALFVDLPCLTVFDAAVRRFA